LERSLGKRMVKFSDLKSRDVGIFGEQYQFMRLETFASRNLNGIEYGATPEDNEWLCVTAED